MHPRVLIYLLDYRQRTVLNRPCACGACGRSLFSHRYKSKLSNSDLDSPLSAHGMLSR
jgi:hypothetical protein